MQTLSPTTAQSRLTDDKAVLIDIRSADEVARAHVPGAVNVPLAEMSGEKLAEVLEGKEPIFMCLSGMRTQNASGQLDGLGISGAAILEGGLNNWRKAGLPINDNKAAPLPIMRQVQITAGALILAGVLLSVFVNPAFIWLAGFVGAGLMFAGISGWCGMANLLAMMPWNKA